MATSAKECASQDMQQLRWPPSILSETFLLDFFFACEELTFNAKSRSLRIDDVNWMSAREKLLLKHANLHDVTPQTN